MTEPLSPRRDGIDLGSTTVANGDGAAVVPPPPETTAPALNDRLVPAAPSRSRRTHMAESKPPTSVGIREIIRWWPLVIVVTLMAAGAAIWSASRQAPSYTATARLMVAPLAQSDETFLGTGLVRDAGDATRTAATVAAQLDSRHGAEVTVNYLGSGWTAQSVAAAVKVSVVENTNLIEIVARSADANNAAKLAAGFATATLADRWRTISSELDDRITALSDAIASSSEADPNAGESLARLHTLQVVRDSGSDPTVRIDSTSPAVRSEQLPLWMIVSLATAGGLFVGLLAAIGMAMLRRRVNKPTDGSSLPAPVASSSPNERSSTLARR
jgi:capsular polysaccharide biosynthesis protein